MKTLVQPASQSSGCNLPTGVEIFTIPELSKILSTSDVYWTGMVECGQLFALDLRSPEARKRMLRISRSSLIEFLEKRAA
jgi:hypothetical protein